METRDTVIEIIRNAPVVVLSTINLDGYPESRALLNLANPKQFPSLKDKALQGASVLQFYLSTNTSSGKILQLKNNPKASMYYCIPEKFQGVWIEGDMELLGDQEEKNTLWIEGWELYYPAGKTDPDYTVLRMTARRMRLYQNISVTSLDAGGYPA